MNQSKAIKAGLMNAAAILTAAAASNMHAGLPIDPTITDPNTRALNIEIGELFKIYYAYVAAAFALSGTGDAFVDPVVGDPAAGSPPATGAAAGTVPPVPVTPAAAVASVVKAATSAPGTTLAQGLANLLVPAAAAAL